MSFFTKPVGKRTRSQRLLYYQECVKNASKAHGSATTTHMDLVTSSDDSQNSDKVKLISIKSEEYANEAHGSALGTHTYFITSSDDSYADAVDILDHDTTSNQFPRSDEKEKVCPRSVKTKGGSQCENIASQSEAGASQRRAGVGVSVTQTSSVRWTKRRIAEARGMATVCVLPLKVYKRFTHGTFTHQQIRSDK
nr:hypothetical protein [Tanacetum cinerariifolium]